MDGGGGSQQGRQAEEYHECRFCKRGFATPQALGGHMNLHRRDRAGEAPPPPAQQFGGGSQQQHYGGSQQGQDVDLELRLGR